MSKGACHGGTICIMTWPESVSIGEFARAFATYKKKLAKELLRMTCTERDSGINCRIAGSSF